MAARNRERKQKPLPVSSDRPDNNMGLALLKAQKQEGAGNDTSFAESGKPALVTKPKTEHETEPENEKLQAMMWCPACMKEVHGNGYGNWEMDNAVRCQVKIILSKEKPPRTLGELILRTHNVQCEEFWEQQKNGENPFMLRYRSDMRQGRRRPRTPTDTELGAAKTEAI